METNNERICSVCGKKLYAKGLCKGCYNRLRARGTTEKVPIKPKKTAEQIKLEREKKRKAVVSEVLSKGEPRTERGRAIAEEYRTTGKTLRELGREYGLSYERIRQLMLGIAPRKEKMK